jgi:AraC-like DNA-binding protein
MGGSRSEVHFSTDDVPRRQRLAAFRDMLGRSTVEMHIKPLTEDIHFELSARMLPGATITWGASSALETNGPVDPGRARDDIIFLWTERGGVDLSQLGRDITVADGLATFVSAQDRILGRHQDGIIRTTVTLKRSMIGRVASYEDAFLRAIDPQNEVLRLLRTYVGGLRNHPNAASPPLEHTIASHLADLIVLMVNADADSVERARQGGLAAVRLEAAKRLILESLGEPDLSVVRVAVALGVTPRLIQRLFEREGTTFSSFVLAQRLAQVHRRLSNPALVGQSIGTVALDAGFGDLSYFNRAFRRTFGETPSDLGQRVRAMWLDGDA